MLFVGLHDEDIKGSFFQGSFVLFRERSVASFDEIIVEGGVGFLWWTDSHDWEVKVVDGVGGDRGDNRVLLPILVRLANEDSCSNEPKAYYSKPDNLF